MHSPFDAHFHVQSGRVRLAVHACGNPEHPVLILVHGYPDNHVVWSGVANALKDFFYVVAYDVRGAGESQVPERVRDYSLQRLSDDLQAVMNAVSPDRPVHLAAHDWGSIQTWESVTNPALHHRIASFTTLSGPCLDHVGHLMRHLALSPGGGNHAKLFGQLLHSWYIFFFQIPVLAPTLWKTWAGKNWDKLLQKSEGIPPGRVHNPHQTQDGVHGVKLYRANMIGRLLQPRERYTDVPVQVLVAKDDPFVGTQLQDRLDLWTSRLSRREFEGGHWHLLLQEPELLADSIREFAVACS